MDIVIGMPGRWIAVRGVGSVDPGRIAGVGQTLPSQRVDVEGVNLVAGIVAVAASPDNEAGSLQAAMTLADHPEGATLASCECGTSYHRPG